jgi:acyl-coenzyme A thioesterase PaaI-like protein
MNQLGSAQGVGEPGHGRGGPFWDAIEGRAPMPPVADLLGWQLESIDPSEGTIRVRFQARQEFTNPLGNIQGGILAAMLDDTMGPALVATRVRR